MQFAHVIKLVLVVDLICAGLAVTGSVVGAILGFMVSGVLCNSVSIPAIRKKYGRDIVEEYERVRKKKFLSMFANQLEDPDTERRRIWLSTRTGPTVSTVRNMASSSPTSLTL